MLTTILLLAALGPVAPDREADLAAARALFERNITAIQERDREAYLSCYLATEGLVRSGPDGPATGFAPLAEGTPATGSDDWPQALHASDLQLHWIQDGVVYGTYRYHAIFDGESSLGLSERFFTRVGEEWKIAVSTAFEAPPGTPAAPLALVGATLYDGSGSPPKEDSVILLRNGRIDAVGTRATLDVPAGIDVLDLTGQYVTPGMIDTHVHYSQTGWADGRPDARDVRETYPYAATMAENRDRPERFHRAFLAAGITAVFDVGGYSWTRGLGADAEDSPLAPHVAATGPLITPWKPEVTDLDDQHQFVIPADAADAARLVRDHAALGSDAIKVWFVQAGPNALEEFTPLVHATAEAAREAGLPMVVHATELATARVALEAGARLLVHSVEDQPIDEAFLELAVETEAFYCPTLTVREGYALLYEARLSDEVRGQLGYVAPEIADRIEATEQLEPTMTADRLELLRQRFSTQGDTMAANLLRLHEAGVPIVLGTDAGNPLTLHGPSVFPELEAMQAAGMTPLEVLTAATWNAARAIGRSEDLGLIASGRIADLLILDGDPGQSIVNMRTLKKVVRAGTLHDRDELVP